LEGRREYVEWGHRYLSLKVAGQCRQPAFYGMKDRGKHVEARGRRRNGRKPDEKLVRTETDNVSHDYRKHTRRL